MGHDPVGKPLCIHQLQVKRYCEIGEDRQPRAQYDGMDGQDVFIDETRCYEALHKSRAANCYDRFPRLGFEFPDPFGKIAVENTRLGPGSRGINFRIALDLFLKYPSFIGDQGEKIFIQIVQSRGKAFLVPS